MKTTIDLDEEKLKRVMELKGFATRKEAIDYALAAAEKIAAVENFLSEPFYVSNEKDVIDPGYDLEALRAMEQPVTYKAKKRRK
jgi:hypothetical protein